MCVMCMQDVETEANRLLEAQRGIANIDATYM